MQCAVYTDRRRRLQTKGKADAACNALNFSRTSVFKPGLLNRGEKARTVERVGMWFMAGLPVASVAGAMVADAVQSLEAESEGEADKGTSARAPKAYDVAAINGLFGALSGL